MTLLNSLILFLVGFFILIRGARWLIKGASSLANAFGLSPWLVGVVIVGVGTSLPELSINLAAVRSGATIGLSTIIGSNTFNILVILGLAALWRPIKLDPLWVRRDFLLNLAAIAIAALVFFLPLAGAEETVGVSRGEGLLLLAVFLAWLVVLGWRNHDHLARGAAPALTLGVSLALILGGLIGVVVGGYWVVGGAKVLATLLGVSEHLIGLTVVAIGTSVPELTVSLTAIFYRQNSLAVGNVIGSNIFDFLGIIGLSAIWRGLPLVESLNFDLGVTALAALLLWLLVVVHPRFKLERWHGFLFLLIYAFYFAFLLARG